MSSMFRSVEIGPSGASITYLKDYGDSRVVVRPIAVGLCISDVKEAKGLRVLRRDFGHEVYGEVVRSDVSSLPPHKRVILDPHIDIQRTTGFADLMMVSGNTSQVRQALLEIDDSVDPFRAIYVEPLACAIHACRKLEESMDRSMDRARIGVIGAGVAGVAIALSAANRGAEVQILNRSEGKLSRLSQLSLASGISLSLLRDLKANSLDAVVIATTYLTADLLSSSSLGLYQNGRILLYGGQQPNAKGDGVEHIDKIRREERIAPVSILGKQVNLVGSYGAKRTDFMLAIDYLDEKSFPLSDLTTQIIDLDELVRYLNHITVESHDKKLVVRI